METLERKVLAWALGGNVGASSRCLAQHLLGMDCDGSYPHDGGDFGRCLKVLEAAPELRIQLHKMAAVNAKWAVLVEHWDELEAAHKAKGGKIYELISALLRPIEDADTSIHRLGTGATMRFGARDRA